jgi:hypothetical protein
MHRVKQRVLAAVVMALLTWPFAMCMSEAQQSIALQGTTQSSEMQVLVIGESVFTSSAQRAIAVTEEGVVFIIDAQYIYSVTANGTNVELRAGSCACIPQRCCCGPVGAPCRWCPGPGLC